MRPRFNPYRCMRGFVPSFTPTNYGTIALLNSSTGAEFLAVWAFYFQSTSGSLTNAGVIQGQLGSAAGLTHPLITGETLYAGTLSKLDTATVYTPDWNAPYSVGTNPAFSAQLPWAILQPGWSLWMQDSTANDAFFGGFIWQSCHLEDLRGMPCKICEPWLERIVAPPGA